VFAIHHSKSQKLKDTFRDRKAQTRLPSCTPQDTTALLTVVHTVKEHPFCYDCFPEKNRTQLIIAFIIPPQGPAVPEIFKKDSIDLSKLNL